VPERASLIITTNLYRVFGGDEIDTFAEYTRASKRPPSFTRRLARGLASSPRISPPMT